MRKVSMSSSRKIVVVLVMALFGLVGLCSVGLGGSTEDAAEWLAAQQNNAGWFPWTPGGEATTNTQGPSGLGVLNAYLHTKTGAFLLSAMENGGYMLDPMWVSLSVYGDGDPRFATHDPLFMESLSASTGDTQYAEFVQANFWGKLTNGTYGASDDLDAAGYGAAVVNGRAGQGIVEISPWDLSATAIAAHLAGEYAIRDALMAAVLDGLEVTTAAGGYDVIGLAGAVWASAITGVDLDPKAGVYTSAGSTADLAAVLAEMTTTADDGAWLYDSTGDPSDPTNADTQTTAFAIAALNAFDRATYIGQIAHGVTFIRGLQQGDGQFLCWPGAPLNEAGSVEVNAEAISAIVYVAPPTVYVDDDFAGLGLGDDPSGDGVAFGYDAFDTIQDGVDEVQAGGTVEIAGKGYWTTGLGEYDENLLIYRPLTLEGVDYPAINPSGGAAIMFRSPGGVPLVGVTIDGIDSFSGSYGILLDEAMFAHLGEELAVGDLSIIGGSWYHNHTAEGIAILNGTYVSNMQLENVGMEENKVGLGISGAGTEVDGLAMQGGSASYNDDHGLLILSGPIVRNLALSDVAIEGNADEGIHVRSATIDGAHISDSAIVGNSGMGLWFQNANVSDLRILGTLIAGNGESGVALHSGTYDGVLIAGSTFEDNGWEHLDLGLWGGGATLNDVQIVGNVFDIGAQWAAIYVDGSANFGADDVQVHYNVFTLGDWAIGNNSGNTIDASLNWWGHAEGPTAGAPVWGSVIFSPWLFTNPDGDPVTVGVQITGPQGIMVAPVGPEPTTSNGNTGYLNQAVAGSNELPYTDTIEVQHGTYDVSEPITDGVNMLSEPGSALHTTLNGDMSIGADNVLIGLPLQGFRVNDNITVEDLVDASSCSINWSDLYGSVTNNGTGTFNAQYNYWGTQESAVIDARTIGDVDIYPYLPKNADESYNDILALIGGGTVGNIDQAIEQLHFMVRQGQNVGEFIRYLAASGAGVFQALPAKARMALGRAAGGGGAIETGVGGIYTVGNIIEDSVLLTDPVTGEPITDAAVTVSLMGEDGTLAFWGCAVYDETIGEYVYSIDTSGLAPGTYELIVQSNDGQSVAVTVDVQAA